MSSKATADDPDPVGAGAASFVRAAGLIRAEGYDPFKVRRSTRQAGLPDCRPQTGSQVEGERSAATLARACLPEIIDPPCLPNGTIRGPKPLKAPALVEATSPGRNTSPDVMDPAPPELLPGRV